MELCIHVYEDVARGRGEMKLCREARLSSNSRRGKPGVKWGCDEVSQVSRWAAKVFKAHELSGSQTRSSLALRQGALRAPIETAGCVANSCRHQAMTAASPACRGRPRGLLGAARRAGRPVQGCWPHVHRPNAERRRCFTYVFSAI
eukprot:364971-Chlamydomonas_euryale.AAC.17